MVVDLSPFRPATRRLCALRGCPRRPPSRDELATIVDYTSNACKENLACFPDEFGVTNANIFASSSTHDLLPAGTYARAIYFYTGYKPAIPVASTAFSARAVRTAD